MRLTLLNIMHYLNQRPYSGCRFAIVALGLSVLLIGCGVRRPPLPPKERVPQRVEIEGRQIGPQILLSWKMPARNAPPGKTMNISRADIYRLAEPLDSPLSLTEDEFDRSSTLITSIPISDEDFGFKIMSFTDTLRFAAQPVRLRYAIRLVNASGQKAGFSNFFLIEPTASVAKAPQQAKSEISQDRIRVSWEPPSENENGTTPANIRGYNIYRRYADDTRIEGIERLNDLPFSNRYFDDATFEFDKKYVYFVRAVSLGADGLSVESLRSNDLLVSPVDTFAPVAPDSLTIAAAPNAISIFFAQNIEPDIAVYKVYRSTDPKIERENWELLTPNGIKTTTFQDRRVSAGTTYYYYVTAVDQNGNESSDSEVVSDLAF